MHVPLIVYAVVVTALAFDFTNGFHDTANAMAPSIATGAFKPRTAVTVSAILNLVGAFLSVKVASTISGGIVDESGFHADTGPYIVFGALLGAIVWNLLTWYLGVPSSSSHALFGGLIGATWVAVGGHVVNFSVVVQKVLLPAVVSPIIAGVAAATGTMIAYRTNEGVKKKHVSRGFRAGQNISASLVSLAHGTNDAQKTMGVITLTFIVAGIQPAHSSPYLWVVVACGLAIALGTYVGGWRIIKTLGSGITTLDSPQGFAAETSATAAILASSHLGYALSTTQVCSGAVLGAGLGKSGGEVRWSTASRIVIAWVVTLPASAVFGACAGKLASTGVLGTAVVAGIGIVVAAGLFALSRRNPVGAHTVTEAPAETMMPATADATY
ncbi:inorganic phosphate transporter [Amycolatopsis cynarae]|uniref:Phosphate transporter n=1 Tax=Amycolatopsis cynarae TaxID=2995223 RepID=A0ABY7B7B9_9PSEU|nr:inorganic phosphate transporter [Amycolatopsis sp. HUAS 11-8]WAL67872.1 inorganic phosphate transporter [Amycolatopsis sp. HUAS 11-8]